MSQYHLTTGASADLTEIVAYYRDKSPAAGDRLLDAILRRCRLLAVSPMSGTPRADLGPTVRSAVVAPYLVFFRPVADGVQILRVIHGARNIDAGMFSDDAD